MRIQVTKELPSINDLAKILKREFSNRYSCKTFGVGQKSILIGKTTLIGAQVSVKENEVSIMSSPPSVFGGFLMTLGLTELALFLLPFLFLESFPTTSRYAQLEREIGTFLQQKYN